MDRRGGAVVGAGMLVLAVFAVAVFLLPFAFPTPPPIVTRFSGTQLFSPNGDGARDTAMISIRVREPGRLTLDVADESRTVVRTLAADQPTRRGWLRIPWRGLGDDGEPLPDGVYSLRLHAQAGGKDFRSSRRIRIDTTPPVITGIAALMPTRPRDGATACTVHVAVAEPAGAEMDVFHLQRRADPPVRRFGPVPTRGANTRSWTWNGRDGSGAPVPAGLYGVRTIVRDAAKNAAVAERSCWAGHISGTLVGPPALPRRRVAVALFGPDGARVAPTTRVHVQLFRRIGRPGPDLSVLGAPVARPVVGPAARVRVPLPPRIAPASLWLVARTDAGAALISPTERRP